MIPPHLTWQEGAPFPRRRLQEDPGEPLLGQRQPGARPSGVVRAYVTMLGVVGGAIAAASVVTTHEAHAAGEGAELGSITLIVSIAHAVTEGPPEQPARPALLPAQSASDGQDELAGLSKSVRLEEERAAAEAEAARKREEAEREALRNRVVWPVQGRITSKTGARWGKTHYGLDVANRIGTPIRAVKRGTVVEAGPASGFGLWVRVRHPHGTTTVYGHIDRALVTAGERVEAGEVVAEVGNRGQSTGPHLHFEVWDAASRKLTR